MTTVELIKNIRSYLNRDPSDLSDDIILMLISMVTAKLNIALKDHHKMRTRVTSSLESGHNLLCLPQDCIQLISLHQLLPNRQFIKYQQTYISGPYPDNQLAYYFVDVGNAIEIFPVPTETIILVMDYYATLLELTADNSNWILNHYADIYLYGAFIEAAIWLKDHESIGRWQSEFETRLARLVTAGWSGHHQTSPVIRYV